MTLRATDRDGSWTREVTFPARGQLWLESHLATPEDGAVSCGDSAAMRRHLDASCTLLKSRFGVTDCDKEIYRTRYHRAWTPAEGGGACGQGIGRHPPRDAEPFVMNMMFAPRSVPVAGERWLVCRTDSYRCVVTAAGYEIGPRSRAVLGGLQGEALHFLGATNNTTLEVRGPLADQTQPYGPVNCGPS